MRLRNLITALITTVGILLVIAGLALLLDPVLVAIVIGGLAMITAAFLFLDGIAGGTLLLALGFLVLMIGSWNFDRAESDYSAASSHQ